MADLRVMTRGKDLLKIGAKSFMDFINPIASERAYISLQKKITLKEEKKWLAAEAARIDLGERIMIVLFADGKIGGICNVMKSALPIEKHNAIFALSVAKEFRGRGYGKLLLEKGIAVAKKKMKCRKLWIEHMGGNTNAAKLYRKMGFVEVARLKGYASYYGKYEDKVIMEYQKKA